ncbi:MAG: glycine zipper family protein [Alphaproteobacteria bacterium]|nr:glycine zipper family protein [Alphaproteobacteria bacterium]
MKSLKVLFLFGTAFLAACASTPMGPTVRMMPPKGKPFEQFAAESSYCKSYAYDQIRGQAEQANQTAFLEGAGGTLLGAGLGAAVGGGRGAAIGAAGGAVAGTAVGAHTSTRDQRGIQQQYNDAYMQCMIGKGNLAEVPPAPVQQTIIYQAPPPPPPTVIYTTPAPQPPPGY